MDLLNDLLVRRKCVVLVNEVEGFDFFLDSFIIYRKFILCYRKVKGFGGGGGGEVFMKKMKVKFESFIV